MIVVEAENGLGRLMGVVGTMQFGNQLVESKAANRAQQRAQEDFRYPFKICCVLRYDIPEANEGFAEVFSFCESNAIPFYSRHYDINRYEEDVYIARLPCYFITVAGYVQRQIHWDEHPIPKIQAHLNRYLEEERKKRERAAMWETRMNRVRAFFTLPSFKRKPKLEHAAPERRKSVVEQVGMEL